MSNLKKIGSDGWLIKSGSINVFPCAYRGQNSNPTARLNTEYNYTHLPHIVDKRSYIVNGYPLDKGGGILKCVIGGYYFEITYDNEDEAKLDGKYLNIRVASPASSTNDTAIVGEHLVRYNYDSTESILDATADGDSCFYGLWITEGAQASSATGYLKLADSARLPIKSNKIENMTSGEAISETFNTETLTADTITVSDKIATKDLETSGAVTFNSGVTVKVDKANKLKVDTNSTTISNAAIIENSITATGKISTSSTDGIEATAGNIVAARGNISATNGNIEATKGNISAEQGTISGKNLKASDNIKIGDYVTLDSTKTGNSLNIVAPNEIKATDNYVAIPQGGTILSVDMTKGIVTAPRIKATITGIVDEAKKVTEQIGDKLITTIFESNGIVAKKASGITAAQTTGSTAGKTIITGTSASNILSLLPGESKKADGYIYNIGSQNQVFDNIYATNFNGTAAQAKDITNAPSLKNESNQIKVTVGNHTSDGLTVAYAETATNLAMAPILANSGSQIKVIVGGKTSNNLTVTYASHANIVTAPSNGTDIVKGSYSNNVAALLPAGSSSIMYNIGSSASNEKFNAIYANIFNGTATNASGVNVASIGNIKVNSASLKKSSAIIVSGTDDNPVIKIGKNDFIYLSSSSKAQTAVSIQTERNSSDAGIPFEIRNTYGSVYDSHTREQIFKVDYAGNVTATTYNATSDRRLKENIIDYTPKKSILALPIKKFDFINGSKNQIGCIAQDLQKICPELVVEDKDGMLSIKESKLIYLLLDEVKKLKVEVNELKNK